MRLPIAFFIVLCPALMCSQDAASLSRITYSRHGIAVKLPAGTLRIDACTSRILHVTFSKSDLIAQPSAPVTLNTCQDVPVKITETASEIILATPAVRAAITRDTARVRFSDPQGNIVLEEPVNGARRLKPVKIDGEDAVEPQQLFLTGRDEAFYGLGQRQEGFLNWHDIPVRLQQVDSQIAIPVVLSNKGYGIFWNNAALTDFNPTDIEIPIDPETRQAAFTTTEGGNYGFLAVGGTGREAIGLNIGNTAVARVNGYLVPYAVSGKLDLQAHTRYTLTMLGAGDRASVYIKSPAEANLTGFRSEVGNGIDYYFFYGPDLNEVIRNYRVLTGQVPLFPKWAYGFLQSRERYSSQKQLLEAAAGFRSREIPVDAIIQDWQYWGKYGWNALRFDEDSYPKPKTMIDDLHRNNLHFMISVWSKFEAKTAPFKAMQAESLLVPGTEWFDAFNPKARAMYWARMRDGLFRFGVDGWWLDATEPEYDALKDKKTYLGLGQWVRNAYPFYVTQAVYEGQRRDAPGQRVMILTRAAYAGQQRHAAASWSGDIGSDWHDLRIQIPAGLNFTMSGIPYWTTDVGGFIRPGNQHESAAYHEVLTRWFEYGAFCPLFRIHGNISETEIWKYGPEVEANFLKYDQLRHRLFPYIYSSAWHVTHDNDTMMRALPLDYRTDPAVADIWDEFLFGSSLLVSPVTEPGATSRSVYLPVGGWFNFWTGERTAGGQRVQASAPLDTIPIYVKEGSILPLGPSEQFVGEKSNPIELRIYPGADAEFTLYDDNGKDYAYEKGEYETIHLSWDDTRRRLTIGPSKGRFAGRPSSREFHIVWARPGVGIGGAETATTDVAITYRGHRMCISAPRP